MYRIATLDSLVSATLVVLGAFGGVACTGTVPDAGYDSVVASSPSGSSSGTPRVANPDALTPVAVSAPAAPMPAPSSVPSTDAGPASGPGIPAASASSSAAASTDAPSSASQPTIPATNPTSKTAQPTSAKLAAVPTASSIPAPGAIGTVPAPQYASAAPSGVTEYAPYFYAWGWGNSLYPVTSLVDLHQKTSVSAVTLAFVLANKGCNATRDIADNASDVAAYIALGGHVKASFGGAGGVYLENACASANELATAIEKFVVETGIADLDFDVEQVAALNANINALRGSALKQVQDRHGIKVSFTLQANPRSGATPGGMTSTALDVVKSALAAGVVISHVNLMTMDYGTTYSSGLKMGELAISAVDDCALQLKSLIPSLTEAQAYAMIGATPMIGQNDIASEVFTLDDAKTLATFAKARHLGLVAFWAINRDQPCPYQDLALCSESQSASFQFHGILRSVQ